MTVSPEQRLPQRRPRYSKEEFAQRGDEIYESQVRQQVEEGSYGKIVAIDLTPELLKSLTKSLPPLIDYLRDFPMPNPGLFVLGIAPFIALAQGA